jgi:hypothetical protein
VHRTCSCVRGRSCACVRCVCAATGAQGTEARSHQCPSFLSHAPAADHDLGACSAVFPTASYRPGNDRADDLACLGWFIQHSSRRPCAAIQRVAWLCSCAAAPGPRTPRAVRHCDRAQCDGGAGACDGCDAIAWHGEQYRGSLANSIAAENARRSQCFPRLLSPRIDWPPEVEFNFLQGCADPRRSVAVVGGHGCGPGHNY